MRFTCHSLGGGDQIIYHRLVGKLLTSFLYVIGGKRANIAPNSIKKRNKNSLDVLKYDFYEYE